MRHKVSSNCIPDLHPEDLTYFRFDLDCAGSVLIVEFDTEGGWLYLKVRPDFDDVARNRFSWTFRLTDDIHSKLGKILSDWDVLEWNVGDDFQHRIIDDAPFWEMKIETECFTICWRGYWDTPAFLGDFIKDLEEFVDGMYNSIHPELDKVTEVYVDAFDGARQINSFRIGEEYSGVHWPFHMRESEHGDCNLMRAILGKYPVVPQAQPRMDALKKRRKLYILDLCFGEQDGEYGFKWDSQGPEWADMMYLELDSLIKRIMAESGRKDIDPFRRQENHKWSVSAESVAILHDIIPMTGARFPFVYDYDVRDVCTFMENMLWKMNRSRQVGSPVDEDRRRKIIVAIEELEVYGESYVDLSALNSLLSSRFPLCDRRVSYTKDLAEEVMCALASRSRSAVA